MESNGDIPQRQKKVSTRRALITGALATVGGTALWKLTHSSESEPTTSDFVRKYNLTPREFSGQIERERIDQSIRYLRNFAEACKKTPEFKSQILADLRIVDAYNYPISIPREAGHEWTLGDIVSTLLKNIDNGEVDVSYFPTLAATSGQVTDFIKVSNEWRRKTANIQIGADLFKGDFVDVDGSTYHGMTDADLATVIVHEFTHSLQDLETVLYPNVKNAANLEEFRNEFVKRRNEENDKAVSYLGLNPDTVYANEAQANAMMCLFQNELERMNNNIRFPGTRRLDPLDDTVRAMQKDYPRFLNLYSEFKVDVIGSNQKAISPKWLEVAGQAPPAN